MENVPHTFVASRSSMKFGATSSMESIDSIIARLVAQIKTEKMDEALLPDSDDDTCAPSSAEDLENYRSSSPISEKDYRQTQPTPSANVIRSPDECREIVPNCSLIPLLIRSRKDTIDDNLPMVVKQEPVSSDDDSDADLDNLNICKAAPRALVASKNLPTLHMLPQKLTMCADELFETDDANVPCYAPSLKSVNQQAKLIGRRTMLCIAPIPKEDNDEQLSQTDRNEQANDDLAEIISFEVELGKSTDFETTTWLFPNTTQCPLQQCSILRPSRTEALNHFCMDHADITMLCTICDELFLARGSADLLEHYRQMHPNDPQPELKTNSSQSVELERSAPQLNIYCWACSKADTNLKCSKCERHFHGKCERHFHGKCVENHSASAWVCIECLKKDVFKPFDVERIPKIVGFIKIDPKFEALKDITFTAEQTQKPIDFSQMEHKTYESVKEFEEDIKWFQHNCRTILPNEREVQEASKRLIGCVKELIQIVLIVSCGECYENAFEHLKRLYLQFMGDYTGSRNRPCSKPHLLLWAKVKGHSYWPAKVMDISTDRKKLYLQFFGDSTGSILQITRNNCYLYSEEYPENKGHSNAAPYLEALKDAREYIGHIQLEFPKFNYAKANVIFNPAKFDDYLNHMITGWDGLMAETSFDSNDNNQGKARKRNVRASNNSSRAKRSRYARGFEYFEQGLKEFQQANHENSKLLADLDKLKNEKESLTQENANLVNEMKMLIAALEEEKKKLDDGKKELEEKSIASKEAFADEKKTLLERNSALEMEVKKLEAEKKDREKKTELLRNQMQNFLNNTA